MEKTASAFLIPRRTGGIDVGSRVPPATGAEPGGERVHTPQISGTYLGDTYLSARQHQNEPLDDVLPFFRLPSFVPDTCCEAQQTGSRRCPDMPSRQAPLSRRDCHCSQPGPWAANRLLRPHSQCNSCPTDVQLQWGPSPLLEVHADYRPTCQPRLQRVQLL